MFITLLLSFSLLTTACTSAPPSKSKSENVNLKQNGLHYKEVNHPSLQLDEMMVLAQKGMVKDCPNNVINSTLKQAKAEWGEPDQIDQAGFGYYASYNEKKIVLGYNAAGEIFDVRSFSDDLKQITLDMIVQSFGQPLQINENPNEKIYVFMAGPNIQLKIIILNSKKVIDHISVFNPVRAVSKNDYILDIKGKSNQLTADAWNNMQKWRKQIVSFSKEHENVYLNGPNKKQVSLTFDDGPDTVITPAIIDILAKYQVKGNFFFIGSKVIEHPDVVKNAFNNGNLTLSHSYHHLELTKLGNDAILAEVDQAGSAIKSVIGKEPAILRPPYGDTNTQVASLAKREGYSIVLWSIDTLDWSQKESKNIINNVVENLRNGDIILMHSDSDKQETLKALPLLIEELQKRNFEIVDLGTLLNIDAYH